MNTRGTSQFEIDANEHVLYNEGNVDKLCSLFLDRNIIKGDLLGPGDPGDFDFGGWHVLCHLVAGCAVFRKSDAMIWMEISHVPLLDLYIATVTVDMVNESVTTFPLLSEPGQAIIQDAKLIGFVEGSSLGHISARDIKDNIGKFNTCTRQEFDMDEKSPNDGGRVWEHWATTRNITSKEPVGISVLKAHLSMTSVCGGRFPSIIARGRTDYYHPEQLVALVKYGFISLEEAVTNITPKPIPEKAELILYSANPIKCVKAIKEFQWDEDNISYFMFKRRIDRWNAKVVIS